jgi:hypothetical protein
MVAVATKKEAMGGQMDLEESIARQTEDRMKELLDMELVGDNSSIETIRRQIRQSWIVPEEMEQ